MPAYQPATAFGARAVTLDLAARHAALRLARDEAIRPDAPTPAAVNKWAVFRALTTAHTVLGLSDRSLALLNALLSFHPETALSLPPGGPLEEEAGEAPDPACDLVVFPSNRALSARAHGMAEKTIRRHLAALVAAGIILRRDSPNGKRYARRAGEGFSDAYGFDLTPLVVRAGEFEAMAEAEKRRAAAMRRNRERISLMRRDISKTVALGLEEGLAGDWQGFSLRLVPLCLPLRRIADDAAALERLAESLARLRAEIACALDSALRIKEMTGNAGNHDRHKTDSNPDALQEAEPAFKKDEGTPVEPVGSIPLGLVLEACPDVHDYADGGRVETWRGFGETVRMIRPMLGISPDAWREAVDTVGEPLALVLVATILQRSEHSTEAITGAVGITVNGSPAVRSPGGYLRALVQQSRAGGLHVGPILMALVNQRQKLQRGARPSGGRE